MQRIGTVRLYHGSIELYDTLKPMGFDLGNLFQKPGWSLFCWKEKQLAKNWAVFQLIRKITGLNFKDTYGPVWDYTQNKALITKDLYKKIKEYLLTHRETVYVYSLDTPIRYLGLGNDSIIDEYTTREPEIIPVDIEQIQVSDKVIRQTVGIVDTASYMSFRRNMGYNALSNRGLIKSCFLINDYTYNFFKTKGAVANVIDKGLREGEIQPGDDLEQYLNSKGIDIKKLGIMKRISLKMKTKK